MTNSKNYSNTTENTYSHTQHTKTLRLFCRTVSWVEKSHLRPSILSLFSQGPHPGYFWPDKLRILGKGSYSLKFLPPKKTRLRCCVGVCGVWLSGAGKLISRLQVSQASLQSPASLSCLSPLSSVLGVRARRRTQ